MKARFFSIVLIIAVVITVFSGCNTEKPNTDDHTEKETTTNNVITDTNIDYIDIYKDIKADFISLFDNTDKEFDGAIGVSEIINQRGKNEALDVIGYAVKDLSGDNIPEFIVGFIDEDNKGSEILALYTVKDEKPAFVFESMTRSAYFLINDGNLFYQGSAGAAYSIFGSYAISENGAELICNDYWFTHEKDKTSYEIGYYHNTTGEYDKAVSEELNITEDEFFNKQSALIAKKTQTDLTPFSAVVEKQEEQTTDAKTSRVVVMFAEDAEAFDEYAVFKVDESEYSTTILFIAEGTVTDFSFLSLSIKDVDENGKATFDTESLYKLDTLTKEKPLEVTLTFYGDSPAYGISYKDAQGVTKNYTVTISGEDGSVILSEF